MSKKTKSVVSSGATFRPVRFAKLRARLNRLTKLTIGMAVVGTVVSVAATVFAISNISPDTGTDAQGSDAFLVIGRLAGGNSLPSPRTNVKLIYKNTPRAVDVFDGPWCKDSKYGDRRANNNAIYPCNKPDKASDVIFEFRAFDNDTNVAVGPTLTRKGSEMTVNGNYRVDLSSLAVSPTTDGKYFIQAVVRWDYENPASCTEDSDVDSTCRTGSNFFRFSIPKGNTSPADPDPLITYATTNKDPAPLTVEAAGPGIPEYSNMSFEFAPPCGSSAASRKLPLVWEDADYDQPNQGKPISWKLYDETVSTTIPVLQRSNGDLGGQGEKRSWPDTGGGYQFLDGHKYVWTWEHVQQSNGVQLYFPFDSYNYVRKCATVSVEKTTNARTNQGVDEPFAYFLKVTHSGPNLKNLTIKDILPAEIQYVDDPAYNKPAYTSKVGQTLQWTYDSTSSELNTLNTTGVLQLQFKVKATAVGTFTNTANGSAIDVNGAPVEIPETTRVVTIKPVDLKSQPFFSVIGGDISAGAGMDLNGNQCNQPGGIAPNPLGSIVGWNRGASNSYSGAGGQYGAWAINHLQGFVSGQATGLAPAGLSFANTGGASPDQYDVGRELYGGEVGSITPCTPDYLAGLTGGKTGNVLLSNLIKDATGTVVPAGGTYDVPDKARRTIFVSSGNVLVDVNVRFNNDSFANVSEIPSFSLLVRGNIYIKEAIRRLDGVYVAQPTNATATNGVIYTCAPADFSTGAPSTNVLNRNLKSNCTSSGSLVFNGAVIARQIWLLRTNGSLESNTPAEVFNYSPETWLNAPFNGGISPIRNGGYDSITSLPPIL